MAVENPSIPFISTSFIDAKVERAFCVSLNAVPNSPIAFMPGAIFLTKGVIVFSISPKSVCISARLSILSSKTSFNSPNASFISPMPLSIPGNSSFSVVKTDQSKPIKSLAMSSKLPNSPTTSPTLPFKPSKLTSTPSTVTVTLSRSSFTSSCRSSVASEMVSTDSGTFSSSPFITFTAVPTMPMCPIISADAISIAVLAEIVAAGTSVSRGVTILSVMSALMPSEGVVNASPSSENALPKSLIPVPKKPGKLSPNVVIVSPTVINILPIEAGKPSNLVSITPIALVNIPSIAVLTGANFSAKPSFIDPNLACIIVLIGSSTGSRSSLIDSNSVNIAVMIGPITSVNPSFIDPNLACTAVLTPSNFSEIAPFTAPNLVAIAVTMGLIIPAKPSFIALNLLCTTVLTSPTKVPTSVAIPENKFTTAVLIPKSLRSVRKSAMRPTPFPIVSNSGPCASITAVIPIKIASSTIPTALPKPSIIV